MEHPAAADCIIVVNNLDPFPRPCLQYGWSATMERIQRAQALSGDSARAKYMRGQRTLEINAGHPLVRELKARVSLWGGTKGGAVQRAVQGVSCEDPLWCMGS